MIIARLQAWLATRALVLALGAVAGATGVLAWEYHAPFGWGLGQRHANAVRELVEAGDKVAGMTADRDAWRDANNRCEEVRKAETRAAADQVAADSDDRARASGAAFDQGYAAGKAVGRRFCTGETHAAGAVPTGADPIGDLVAERVRDQGPDFADLWKPGADDAGGAVRPRDPGRPSP